MNVKNLIAGIFFAVAFLGRPACLELENVVPRDFYDQLMLFKTVSVIHEEDDDNLSLVPYVKFSRELNARRIEKNNSPYTAEFLYLISKQDLLAGGKNGIEKVDIQEISKIFTTISNMSGMRFRFSEKNPEGIVLYNKVYPIESLEKGKRIEDRKSTNCNGMNVFCYQHDKLLGNLKFLLEYHQSENEIYLSILNEVPLGLFGVHACQNENLRINIHVTDCGENILFYIAADANYDNVLKMFSIRSFIERLMLERLEAIYRWFFLQF